MHIEILRGSGLVCEMDVDFEHKQVQNYKKYTNDFWILPFNNKLNEISFEMFEGFLESRCPDRDRYDLKELLENWGLIEFDSLGIVKKTHGLMLDDFIWIRFEGENISYADIKVRDYDLGPL